MNGKKKARWRVPIKMRTKNNMKFKRIRSHAHSDTKKATLIKFLIIFFGRNCKLVVFLYVAGTQSTKLNRTKCIIKFSSSQISETIKVNSGERKQETRKMKAALVNVTEKINRIEYH